MGCHRITSFSLFMGTIFLVPLCLGILVGNRQPRYSGVVRHSISSVGLVRSYFPLRKETHWYEGAGVLITPNGHVLTVAHLFMFGHKDVKVSFLYNLKEYQAKILKIDPKNDLALLKIDLKDTPYCNLSEDQPVLGQEVIAIGHPLDLQWSVSNGIVSSVHRTAFVDDNIQFTAVINHGNSGGPLFDLDGDVLGIVDSMLTPVQDWDGYGFAIPTTKIREFLSDFQGLDYVSR